MPITKPVSSIAVVLTPTGGTTGSVTGGINVGVAGVYSPLPIQLLGLSPLTSCSEIECRSFNGGCYIEKALGKVGVSGSTYENDVKPWFVDDQMKRKYKIVIQKLDSRFNTWSDLVTVGSNYTSFITSYGTLYTYGHFTTHPTYFGYQINWGSLLTLQGVGTYRIKFEALITWAPGRTQPFPYCMVGEPYKLMPYSCELADRTVKFEVNQSGKIGSHLSNGYVYDLCNMTLYDSVRVPGIFGSKKGSYDEIMLEYQNGQMDRVRDETILKYQFSSNLLPQYIHDRFMVYGLMADSLFVSDYNKINSDYNIKKKSIVKTGGYEPNYKLGAQANRKSDVKIDFKDGIQSIIKSTSCEK